MENPVQWQFADFCLDVTNACLRRQERQVKLKPKTVDILRYLIERSGRLVTKGEMFAALWPETLVSDGVLTTSINELRTALTDDAKTPRFIETVHRRGYRFIAPVTTVPPPVQSTSSTVQDAAGDKQPWGGNGRTGTRTTEDSKLETGLSMLHHPLFRPNAANVVGRDLELADLHKLFVQALSGTRQIVFLTGEPGIGKTRLVEAFLATIPSHEAFWVGHGQCIDQYGDGEAYLPVLEALGRLGRGLHGAQVTAILRQYAPMWLLQLPALLTPTEREILHHQAMGGTHERMLRELSEALEALTVTRPLVLVLEDLHWSDLSTLKLLAALARRQESARLLIVGTYRPVDVIVRAHPVNTVKQELQVHGLCQEIALPYLSAAAVAAYLAQRFAQNHFPPDLATMLFQRTEGNPLFMVNIVNNWVSQGAVTQVDGTWTLLPPLGRLASMVSSSLTQFVERQITLLDGADQELLEAASVMGGKFSVAAVASAINGTVTDIEGQCERLARQRIFLERLGEEQWPEQRQAPHYGFLHTLYQTTWYARLPPGRRALLHQRFGEWLERTAGAHASQRAAELAVHFEEGQDYDRAVQYRRQAGETALRRSANQEAVEHFTKGLTLLEALPKTPDHVQQELTLYTLLGAPLVMSKGYAAREVEHTYARARELCQQLGESPQLFPALLGLWSFYLTRGEFQVAQELGQHLLRLAQEAHDPALLLGASRAVGITRYYLLDDALTGVHSSSEYNAELYRLKGEFLLKQSKGRGRAVSFLKEAEEYFGKAIAIAQQQKSKSLELRAVMSLSRLWRRQGKRREAQRMLSNVYRWFTEGFDTQDLQDAKTLLAELT